MTREDVVAVVVDKENTWSILLYDSKNVAFLVVFIYIVWYVVWLFVLLWLTNG